MVNQGQLIHLSFWEGDPRPLTLCRWEDYTQWDNQEIAEVVSSPDAQTTKGKPVTFLSGSPALSRSCKGGRSLLSQNTHLCNLM